MAKSASYMKSYRANKINKGQVEHSDKTFGIDTGEYENFADKYEAPYLRNAAIRYTMENLGVTREEARRLNSDVNSYSDRTYSIVRQFQQGKKTRDDALAERVSNSVETYIEKSKKWQGGTTFRGVSLSSVPKVGETINMGGTSSWSTNEQIARDFSRVASESFGGKRVVYYTKKQLQSASARHLSTKPHEYEVLASRRSNYTVVGVKDVDGVTMIELKAK